MSRGLVRQDLHIHATAYRAGGRPDHTVRDVVRACREQGLRYAGILEHLNADAKHPLGWMERLVHDFRELELPANWFIGVEADVHADGSDSCGPVNRRRLRLDYVIGSVHVGPQDFQRVEEYIEEEFRRISLVMERNSVIDIIGHPWVQGIRWERSGSIPRWQFALVPRRYQERIIELALEHGKAIEVNNPYAARNRDAGYREFLGKLLDAGVKISIGSDAHDIREIERSRMWAGMLARMGFKDERLWLPESPPGRLERREHGRP